jgi:hypothetical protein
MTKMVAHLMQLSGGTWRKVQGRKVKFSGEKRLGKYEKFETKGLTRLHLIKARKEHHERDAQYPGLSDNTLGGHVR